MKLILYPVSNSPYKIQPASQKRQWMDIANAKNPYRCLPLTIANSYGWEVLSPTKFRVVWDGTALPTGIKVETITGYETAVSLFGEGTFTWHTGHLFKTEYPYALYVTGAPNYPKHNVIALSGIVETYWLPFTFTMNWRFTEPGEVIIEKDEPICQLFPVDITMFDTIEPEIHSLSDDPEFEKEYWNWNFERHNFVKKKNEGLAKGQSWQRNYIQGNYPPTGEKKCPFHVTPSGVAESMHKSKLIVPEFVNKQTASFQEPQYHKTKMKKLYP